MTVPLDMQTLVVAAVLVGLTAAVTAAVLRRRTQARLSRFAQHVRGWLGADDPQPLGAVARGEGGAGEDAWTGLTRALDALAASYAQRGRTLDAERPWRTELVEALAQPALLFDADGRLHAANRSACDLMGTGGPARGSTILEATASTGIAEIARRVRDTGEPMTVDVEREGRELRVVVSLLGDETLIVLADRTRERQIEDLRRDFVVNASHELKTPVTAIQTLGDAIAVTLPTDPARAAALVKRLNTESERLARLVNELLDLRRLEVAGPLERVPVDLAELVRLVVAEQLPRAEARDVAVTVDAPESAPVAGVHADLEAIVKNLVSNAVKYNRERGRVDVTLRTEGAARILTVSDTGIGIRQQDLPRIFERFYRVDTARSRATGGTGLGLSIVRHAVERHGGNVRVESTLGEGTTFRVTLPIDADRAAHRSEQHGVQPNRPEM
jgi:signal transduction histidine kinase